MNLNEYAALCHQTAVDGGWWNDLQTGESLVGVRNRSEMMMLMVSEIAEAMEGLRKDKMDDHLPYRKMEEVELVDLLIRVFDYAGAYGLDLEGAFREKLVYNMQRADHKPANRRKSGGKAF